MPSETAPAPRARLQQAITLLQQRKLPQAEAIFDEWLRDHPDDPDALHFRGVAALWSGRTEMGVALIQRSVQINPRDPAPYCNLSPGLSTLRRFDDAVACCDRALLLDPGLAEVHVNRGAALAALNRRAEAIASFGQALAIRPRYLSASLQRADAHFQLRHLPEALADFDQVIAIEPRHVGAFNCRACILNELGRSAEALPSIDQAIALNENFVEAHQNRGKILYDLQRYEESLVSCRAAMALRPDFFEAENGAVLALMKLERFEEALALGQSIIARAPDDIVAISNLGCILHSLRRYAEAVVQFDRAIALKANSHGDHSNRGLALKELGRIDEATQSWAKAIELAPDFPDVHQNLAVCYADQQRYAEAIASWDRAIALKPDYAEAHFGKSLIQLLCGDFATGWQGYEARQEFLRRDQKQQYPQPRWDGTPGKTVLIRWEQGFGDTIQFCRYVNLVSAHSRVLFLVQNALLPLLKQLEPAVEVIGGDQVTDEFDYDCTLLSLPGLLGTDLQTIPSAPSYLVSDPERRAHFENFLPLKGKLRVGLVWRGNPDHKGDRRRSIDPAALLPLLRDDIEFVSLQKDLIEADAALLRADGRIIHLGDQIADFADTAALADLMDLVISVDSAVAHLAGALGKPTWILLPINPDWRWLRDRPDSPWYPSVRLFRQDRLDDWSGVFDQLAGALSSMV